MLLEHKNAIVYGGGRRDGPHSPARGLDSRGRTRESLDELGKAATFMARMGGPMTATFANITCGAILD